MDTMVHPHRRARSRDRLHEQFPSLIAGLGMCQSTSASAIGSWVSDSEFIGEIVKIGDEQSDDSDCANG